TAGRRETPSPAAALHEGGLAVKRSAGAGARTPAVPRSRRSGERDAGADLRLARAKRGGGLQTLVAHAERHRQIGARRGPIRHLATNRADPDSTVLPDLEPGLRRPLAAVPVLSLNRNTPCLSQRGLEATGML